MLALVVPGSGLVKAQAEKEGLDRVFKDSGFEWRDAGCSMCLGMNDDRLSPGERCASTDRKSTRLNSSHANISYAVFCLKKKKIKRAKINDQDCLKSVDYQPPVVTLKCERGVRDTSGRHDCDRM